MFKQTWQFKEYKEQKEKKAKIAEKIDQGVEKTEQKLDCNAKSSQESENAVKKEKAIKPKPDVMTEEERELAKQQRDFELFAHAMSTGVKSYLYKHLRPNIQNAKVMVTRLNNAKAIRNEPHDEDK